MGRKRRDWINERFGKLVVVDYSDRQPNATGYLYVICRCDCGKTRELCSSRLTKKNYPITCCEDCASEKTKESHKNRARREELETREAVLKIRQGLVDVVPSDWLKLPLTKKHADELGEKRYFNGKECVNGHLCPSYANSHGCCKCSDLRLNEWRESDDGKKWQFQYAKERWADEEKRAKQLELRREWANANPERIKELKRSSYYKHWVKNREKAVAKWRKRYQSDPAFRLRCTVSRRIHHVLKDQNATKSKRSLEYLGCTPKELKKYLEKKFKDGMSWESYGQFGWHVDHIRPCASFDLNDEEQASECFHFTNLQPMWWRDNIVKGDNWDDQDLESLILDDVFLDSDSY